MKLLIVESPKKVKTIEKFLSKDYVVTSSKGHFFNLPKKEIGINLNNFSMKMEIIEGAEGTIKNLRELMGKASIVYLATDPDREGEAIAVHLTKLIPKGIPFKRVEFEELRKEVILKAIDSAKDIDENLYDAQKSRRILDRLMGFKISPLLWSKIAGGLSAGRVQSVGLRAVLDKEKQIRKFIPEEYFNITAFVKDDIKIQYYGSSIKDKIKLKDKALAEKILKDIKDQKVFVVKKDFKEKKENPKPPFSTSDLQQEAFKKFKMNSKKTMQIAQKLYEGKSLGEMGTHGLISYMRTDSYRINEEKMKELKDFIKENHPEYISKKEHVYVKDGASQNAHEAIRPTSIEFEPEKIKKFLSDEEFIIYELIWKRFISSQMSPAIYEQSTVYFKINNHIFFLSGKLQKSKGYLEVYNYTKNNDVILPSFEEGEENEQSSEAQMKSEFTKPPQRYTEATFIKFLEKKGIGRPSTFASIVSNIKDKKYIREDENHKYHVTKLGEILCESLLSSFKEVFEYNFTSNIEKELDLVAEGKLDYLDMLKDFWNKLEKEILQSGTDMLSFKAESIPTGKKCTNCANGHLHLNVKGISSISCDRCDYKENGVIIDNKFKKKSYKQKICPTCESGFMIERNGKYGKFLACNNNSCKFISPITIGVKCLTCNTGEYAKKKSKKGNIYYKCSLQHCDGIIFNQILKKKCPFCANHFLTKDKDGKISCPACEKNIEN